MHNILVAAVDFGSSKLSASLGMAEEDEIKILGTSYVPSEGIEKGFITDEVKCSQKVNFLLKKLESSTKESIKEVYAGISTRKLRITEFNAIVNLNGEKILRKHIKKAIEQAKINVNLLEGEEIVDVAINFYHIDDKVFYNSVSGIAGDELKVNLTIILGPREELDKIKHAITSNGYIFKGFIANVMSCRNVFLQDGITMNVNALVDIGGGTSDIAIFEEGTLRDIRSIALGGNNVTKDIAICGEYSIDESEKIKLACSNKINDFGKKEEGFIDIMEIGSLVISKTLVHNVVNARLEELFKIINNELKKSSYYQGICSIIIYGDGIVYYQNVNSIVEKEFNKDTKIITNEYLGMKNSFNISSLAIVKEVFDRLNLINKFIIKNVDEEVAHEKLLNEIKERETSKETEKGILHKLKSFLEDVF